VVVGTRDCSLQRRHQKLVEEAPAPFLTGDQRAQIHESAKAICREAGYHGAGTVEYLVGQDGTISFLEVNTRLQVEHPVSEETAGIDLVREQFRIAAGEALRWTADPAPHGHSIEFRINGEDAGRGFLPAPGTVTSLTWPSGPGVRVDAGVEQGGVIGGNFDSMLAKIIITGADREEALSRARRALDETVIEGIATVLPFHRLVVRDEAFTSSPFTVHTRWIETEWAGGVEPFTAAAAPAPAEERETVVVEVAGKRLEVRLPANLFSGTRTQASSAPPASRRARSGHTAASSAGATALTAPMQGTIVKVAVQNGDQVSEGDVIVVVEAMKMEQPLQAHRSGTVSALTVEVGATVTAGATICTID
jgi:acetyl-CoA/propionyl-CoA carboxylase biotin carboxyl carrier protein